MTYLRIENPVAVIARRYSYREESYRKTLLISSGTGLTCSTTRLLRNASSIVKRWMTLSPCLELALGVTHFVYILKLPLALYRLGQAVKARRHVWKWVPDDLVICGRVGVISNIALHILKGFYALGMISGKVLAICVKSPPAIVLGSFFFATRILGHACAIRKINQEIAEYKKARSDLQTPFFKEIEKKLSFQKMALVSALIDGVAIGILSFTPFSIAGYGLLTISATLSIFRYAENLRAPSRIH